jgi:hypothetical protein
MDATTERLFGELIAALAKPQISPWAFRVAEERRIARAAVLRKIEERQARELAAARRAVAASRPMPVIARLLTSAAATGDQAAADVLLSRPKSNAEWRELVLLLASAADLERLAAPGPANHERRAA